MALLPSFKVWPFGDKWFHNYASTLPMFLCFLFLSFLGMGYDESQYSLPRWQDLSISRQGMYDDLFHYTPTVGWMFLPLVDYHGGGELAAFEPLSEHLVEYDWALAQYFGAGVAACYRGYRLYDSNATRLVVKKWVDFFRKYRDILTSDVVHIRRPDMQVSRNCRSVYNVL